MGKNQAVPYTHAPDAVDATDAAACCVAPPAHATTAARAGELAGAFKAIGHPVRLQILDLLSRCEGQLCVCDVEACFSLSQPTISHHLRVLREAGLVGAEQRGLWTHYHVRRDQVEKLRALLGGWAVAAPQPAIALE